MRKGTDFGLSGDQQQRGLRIQAASTSVTHLQEEVLPAEQVIKMWEHRSIFPQHFRFSREVGDIQFHVQSWLTAEI